MSWIIAATKYIPIDQVDGLDRWLIAIGLISLAALFIATASMDSK